MTQALRVSPLLETSKSRTPAEGQGLDGHACPSWAANLEESLLYINCFGSCLLWLGNNCNVGYQLLLIGQVICMLHLAVDTYT